MRIVTRPDFDGIVCVVLIQEAENSALPVLWASPNDMQRGLVDVQADDIIANLPYNSNCDMWFDHHFSNQIHQSSSRWGNFKKPFDWMSNLV